MALLPADYLTDVWKKGYEKGKHQGEEISKEREIRLKGYMSICISGLTSLYWSGTLAMLSEIHNIHPTLAYIGVVYSLTVLLLNLLGIAAAAFPSTTPWAVSIAGLGAWQAVLSVLATFHLSTFKLHPRLLHSLISMFVSSSIVTIFWGIWAQDPLTLHVLAKHIVWRVNKLCFFIISLLAKACNCADISCLTDMYHIARDFLAATPHFLPASFMTNITEKGYRTEKSEEEIEKVEETRLDAYLKMCLSGATTLYWSKAATILLDLSKTNYVEAYCFVMYSLFSLTVILIAVTAATFPSTSPTKMDIAGFGALQSILFVISAFHIATLTLHLQPMYFWISMAFSSALFTIFWGISSQDPLFIHITAKCTVWFFSWMIYGLYLLVCIIVRKGRDLWNSLVTAGVAAGGNDPTLQGPLLAPPAQQHNPTP